MSDGSTRTTLTLDLGCGTNPKNPFNATIVYGIDLAEHRHLNVLAADLAIERIPFDDGTFDYVTAFDFLEHIPRVIYAPTRRFCFVELMNEVYRILKHGGLFLSSTPAFPHAAAWRDPTHVNVITDETFDLYFDDVNRAASIYGFKGAFNIRQKRWSDHRHNLIVEMQKVDLNDCLKQAT